MALDPTANEKNIRDSIRKYFVDTLRKIDNVPILFDLDSAVPNIQGKEVDRWVTILGLGDLEMGIPSVCTLEIHCCARQDKDGFKLAGVRDKVMGRITDLTQPDGCARIPLYRSYESQDWVQISSMKFAETIIESKEMRADDRTKFKIITTTLMWGAKI